MPSDLQGNILLWAFWQRGIQLGENYRFKVLKAKRYL